jgi:poly-gamma-glutamate biosynthesis protein PgsC/CapC
MNFSAVIPPQDVSSLCVGLGILIGLVWTRRTGWGCGGLITPGLLALYAGEPWRAAAAVAFGALLAPALSLLSRVFRLYGRERLGAAMLLALCARMALPLLSLPVDSHWVGWVVPGLIAADANRQGLGMTVCGAVACAVATAFAFGLLQTYTGAVP